MQSTMARAFTMVIMAAAAATGCAHGWNAPAANQEVRGSLQLAAEARLLVTGPASHVHTSVNGAQPVSLFVADVVNGDDGDCAGVAAPSTAVATDAARRLRVPRGQVLCAISMSRGTSAVPTELLWHAHRDPIANPVALQ
jgi:hypothetical protein